MKNENNFNWRRFVSLFIFLTFLVVGLTGIVLYLTPPGRVARWFDWRFLGLSKDQWQAVHTVSSFAFLIASIFHVFVFNWRCLLSYLKKNRCTAGHPFREIVAALLIFFFLFLGSVFNWPPLSQVVSLGETLKNSWEKGYQAKSAPQDQDRSLADYLALFHRGEASEILDKMRQMGLLVEGLQSTIKDIAAQNKRSPQQVAELLKSIDGGNAEARPGSGAGRMITNYPGQEKSGRKTVEETALEYGLELADLLERLAAGGIRAEPGFRLNRIARDNGLSVAELKDLIAAFPREK